ncbi:hypothetical protein ABTM79_19105, partial [Acinetobacter baumannii]
STLMVTARSDEGEIMALAHRHQPTYGVQFHPESVLTQFGRAIFSNFLRLADLSGREDRRSSRAHTAAKLVEEQ